MKNKKILKFVSIVGALSLFIVPCALGNTSSEIIDLTDTTWTFDDIIYFNFDDLTGITAYDVNFTVTYGTSQSSYTELWFDYDVTGNAESTIDYYNDIFGNTPVYDSFVEGDKWREPYFKTITFTGGIDVDSAALISVMEQYATREIKSLNIFDSIFKEINNLFFGGTVKPSDNTVQSLIVLGLTSIFTVAFIVIPFVIVYWIIKWLGSLFHAV